MPSESIREAPIDTTLNYYMEERALEIALSKAKTDGERAKVQRLIELRCNLLRHRAAHSEHMTAMRHARGEIYSDAKVMAINAMAPTKDELDQSVRTCYQSQVDVEGVLKAHARIHFGQGLISQSSLLTNVPNDIVDAARQMLALEKAFAAEWIAAIEDSTFHSELRKLQRDTMAMFRNASTPMFLVATPSCPDADALDSGVLGRAWNKLDALSDSLGIQPLSTFIGIEGQSADESASAEEVLITVDALLAALQDGKQRIPAKQATREVLTQLRNVLLWLQARQGRVYFDADF